MFIPVAHHPHTTIINKTIVYSDTVLNLKDMGENIKLTTISDVGEYSLEDCIKTILDSNPNVTFNTIQYSKNDKKIYFYTNPEIDTKSWDEINVFVYEPLKSKKEILSEVNRLLSEPLNKRKDCISLYDVAMLMKNKNEEEEKAYNYYKDSLEYKLGIENSSARVILYSSNDSFEEIKIGYKQYSWQDYKDVIVSKENDDLYIKSSEMGSPDEVLLYLGEILSKLYDRRLDFKNFREQYKYDINSENSNFIIDISGYGVTIKDKKCCDEFSLCSYSYKDDYEYDCNSTNVINALRNKEDEIFKRIFVKIDDCPEWTRTQLYIKRQDELTAYRNAENKRRILEQKAKEKEMKRVRRKNLIRKIFPFGK